ncbi:MAG: SLBB domain-containing protein [Acidobacteriaceae bacterium]
MQTGIGQPHFASYSDLGRGERPTMEQQLPVTLPPEPLTEFQKFVASTTGQVLPIFGANLFRQVPSTFSPLNLAPVPPDYVIGPGDELRIRVWGQVNFSANVRVDRTGEIYLPQVGEVHVAGIPYSALDAHLRAAIGRVYRNFDLTADIGQIRAIQVYVSGEARRPGVYTVSSLSTLVDAVFASGGPSSAGSLRHIELRRGGNVVTVFDLYALLIHGDKSKDAPLEPGDVIFIPPVGPQVALTGSIRNPAIYELQAGESLAEAIADAGGATAVAAETRVSIERIDDHRDRYSMEVSWDPAGLATRLADGDLIHIYPIVPMYQNTITLRGNIANPGRFAWHEGMRLSDLIPDRASLVTRNYWWKRSQLGLPGPEFEPLENFRDLRQPSGPVDLPRGAFLSQHASGNAQATPNGAATGTAAGRGATGNAAMQEDQYLTDQNVGATVMAAQNGTASSEATETGNESAVPASQRASNASLAAGYNASPSAAVAATRTEVGPIAPDIDWDYAVIERLDAKTLKTTLIPFDLGRLVLDHDASQDLALEPGDVITIFSQADIRVPIAQETKFVRLEGEFVHAGVYTVHSGETLRELVQRAGGFTPNAYLYGSQFTRESTRILQQQRMDEYVQQLQLEMQRGVLALASSATMAPQALSGAGAAQGSEQDLIARLRAMRATGRIVLQFNSGSRGLAVLPDIQLQNGDKFVVPPVPASINVVGAVYDQNSFLYQAGLPAGAYLHLAGGPNRDADRKHMFIIRADGSVVSREAANNLWGNDFLSLRMNPGDTIVVPEKVFRPSPMIGIMGWSQLFSQFALGAAALTVIQ